MPDVMDIHTGAEQNEPGPDGVVDGTFIGEHWGGFPPIINRVILYCQTEPGSNEVNRDIMIIAWVVGITGFAAIAFLFFRR